MKNINGIVVNSTVTFYASAFIGSDEYCVAASSQQQAETELQVVLRKIKNVKSLCCA